MTGMFLSAFEITLTMAAEKTKAVYNASTEPRQDNTPIYEGETETVQAQTSSPSKAVKENAGTTPEEFAEEKTPFVLPSITSI